MRTRSRARTAHEHGRRSSRPLVHDLISSRDGTGDPLCLPRVQDLRPPVRLWMWRRGGHPAVTGAVALDLRRRDRVPRAVGRQLGAPLSVALLDRSGKDPMGRPVHCWRSLAGAERRSTRSSARGCARSDTISPPSSPRKDPEEAGSEDLVGWEISREA